MKRKDVFAAFARKLGISRQNLENYRINDGRIYLPYLQSIFTDIKKQLQSDRKNYNLVDEFSGRQPSHSGAAAYPAHRTNGGQSQGGMHPAADHALFAVGISGGTDGNLCRQTGQGNVGQGHQTAVNRQ